MRVGLVTQPADGVLPPRQNSIGLIMYNTAVELAGVVDVSLILKRWPSTHYDGMLPFHVEAIETPLDDRIGDVAGRYPRWAGRLGLRQLADRYPQYARKVSSALRRRSCDVAHVMNYWQWCRRLQQKDCAVVLEMQSEWLSQMDRASVLKQLAATDAVVGVSDHILSLFRESFPSYRGHVATAYNGVDTNVFSPASDDDRRCSNAAQRLVLFVGRLSPEKGVHTLIEAFARVAQRIPGATLELAGPRTILPSRFLVDVSSDSLVRGLRVFYDGAVTSDYQGYLDRLIVRYGLEERVRFLGQLPHHELVARYQSACLVVNPSYSESFGISVVEGMACGVPVVGTRIGGMRETILEGDTGFLVDPGDSVALAEAMIRILDDASLSNQMGTSGRSRALQHFSWKARANRLLEVYKQVAR